MKQIALIEMEGEAYERGRQYGTCAREAIRQNLEAYLRLFAYHAGMSREAAFDAVADFSLLEAQVPELVQEMRGIADGAGCELADVLLINSRTELMAVLNECTSLAVTPEVTVQRQPLLGQNWDWYTAVEPEPVLLRIRQPGKPEILTLAEAGQVGKIGMNSAGLGMCLNFLSHTDRAQGLPIHVVLRQMLGCEALGQAVRLAYSLPRSSASNLLLAHAQGEILDLELTAATLDFIYGDDGWLVHANHFESARLRAGDTGVTTSWSTVARTARARRLLSAAAAQRAVSMDTFRAILRDHAYGAYAICRHAEPVEAPLQQTATRASVIMDLTARTLYLAAGQPCTHDYQAFQLVS